MKYIPNAVSRKAARAVLQTQKHSPNILFGLGVAGAVTATVLACKSTLKLGEELDTIEQDIRDVKRDLRNTEGYRKDLVYVYAKGGLSLAKLYAPAILVGTVSVAALTGSHVQLNRRNAGLTAAYAGVNKAYDEYRDRVREAIGEDKERDLHIGANVIEVEDENGKKQKVKVVDPNVGSPYARFFDASNANWQHNQEYNRLFLQAQQSYANHLLQARGHVFLNEIYDNLGLEHTAEGAVTGWVMGNGDNFIDFGIYDIANSDTVVFGENADMLLDFNVDGEIYKLI